VTGVEPYPRGLVTATEDIEAGELREERPASHNVGKARAIEKGRALVAALPGKGWQLRVWQNSGWHYRAIRGDLSIRQDGQREYCFIFEEAGPLNMFLGGVESYARTPAGAYRRAMVMAQALIEQTQARIAAARGEKGSGR